MQEVPTWPIPGLFYVTLRSFENAFLEFPAGNEFSLLRKLGVLLAALLLTIFVYYGILSGKAGKRSILASHISLKIEGFIREVLRESKALNVLKRIITINSLYQKMHGLGFKFDYIVYFNALTPLKDN